MIVCISDGIHNGYGEATVNPYYNSTIERLAESLNGIQSLVENVNDLHPSDFWEILAPHLQNDYFSLCAIDVAYWDFYAKKNNKTVRSFWTTENLNLPLTSYTIGIDSVEVMQQKIIEKPWPVYKIKLGTENDLEIIRELRKVTNSLFRIDANCAWTAEQTIEYARILKDYNVEFIEQPLKANDLEGMRKLKKESVLPIIADESCQRETDVLACAESFHGINIKLMKCGGITPALRMVDQARKLNLKIMAGCMTESTVGISALVQLAPLLDFIDADGALLLKQDIAGGVSFDNGQIIYSSESGTGVELLTN